MVTRLPLSGLTGSFRSLVDTVTSPRPYEPSKGYTPLYYIFLRAYGAHVAGRVNCVRSTTKEPVHPALRNRTMLHPDETLSWHDVSGVVKTNRVDQPRWFVFQLHCQTCRASVFNIAAPCSDKSPAIGWAKARYRYRPFTPGLPRFTRALRHFFVRPA